VTTSLDITSDSLNVVLNFHKADQFSARLILELLMSLEEGIETHYYLQYGDDESTIAIQDTLSRFLKEKKSVLSTKLPEITIPQELIENDPNQQSFEGNHTYKNQVQKHKILQWNLAVFKYIHQLDHFLMLEPDCLLLKDNWAQPIYQAYLDRKQPIVGHLKRGKIADQFIPTHFAGCSLYDGIALRKLPLETYFYERYDNPWWPLRDRPGTTTANNAFLGPAFSGYDISYDYFLYALYFRELTGSNNPFDWPSNCLESREDLIVCDFRSRLTIDEIFEKYYGKISFLHGVKDDAARHAVLRAVRSKGLADRLQYPIGGKFEVAPIDRQRPVDQPLEDYRSFNVLRPDNSSLLSIADLRDQFAGNRCFIIGNGPSLKKTDLSRLKQEFTFGLNRIYLNYEAMGFEPTFYCCVNPNVTNQFAEEIDRLNSVKFITDRAAGVLKNHWNTFFMHSIQKIGFNEDLNNLGWHEGWTVTYCAMQVAFHLGFEEVILVGVDHYFKQSGEPNKAVTAEGPDANHFHPDYFGKGVVWQYPDLDRSEQSYTIAKEVYERHNRHILDATVGGHLQIFPKVDFDQVTLGGYTLLSPDRSANSRKSVDTREPLVSIIMPAYNAAETIAESIQSIQQQDYQNWELLVINDFSQDATVDVVKRLQTDDDRIKLYDNQGIGTSEARNTGLERAAGTFITLLDSDDILYEGALRRRVDALQNYPERSIVSCTTRLVDNQLQPLDVEIQAGAREFTFADIHRNLHPNSLMGRAEVMKRFRFDSEHDGVEDWVYLSRILRSGYRVVGVDDCAVAYRIRGNSVVMADFNAHEERCRKVIDLIYGADPKCPDATPEFAPGLSNPDKPSTIAKRYVGLLTNLILNCQHRAISRLLPQIAPTPIAALSDADITSQIRFATIRTLCCHQSVWQEQLTGFRDRIVTVCQRGGLVAALPHYTRILFQLSGMSEQEIQPIVAAAQTAQRQVNSSSAMDRLTQSVALIEAPQPVAVADQNGTNADRPSAKLEPSNGKTFNGKSSTQAQTQPEPQPKTEPETTDLSPVDMNRPTSSSARLATSLLGRIGRYYSRWPLGIAVLAAALNTVATMDDIPLQWAFSGSGSLLLLFLVGHAASKADVALQVGDRSQIIAEQADQKATSAFKRGTRAMDKAKLALQTANQTTNTVKSATSTANSALSTAKAIGITVKSATEMAQRTASTAEFALEIANRASGTAKISQETADRALNTSETALETAQAAADTAKSALNATNSTSQEVAALNEHFTRSLQAINTAVSASNQSNTKLFQPFARQLSQDNLDTLSNVWLPALNLQLDRRALGYLAHRVCVCEDACSGRLATSVQDMVLRILVARSIRDRNLSVLEIGSLFGINLAILYESCRDHFETIHLTAIDPLDVYSGKSTTDVITQVPVTRKIFEHNMRQIDVPIRDVTLIPGLSTEHSVLEKAGQRQYNLLIIDGDRSYEGVKFDFDHYLPAVDLGGYVIFDDYGTEQWPDVTEFVDREVQTNSCVEFVGASNRTGVFRVIRKNLR
jgi:hypothetical protein